MMQPPSKFSLTERHCCSQVAKRNEGALVCVSDHHLVKCGDIHESGTPISHYNQNELIHELVKSIVQGNACGVTQVIGAMGIGKSTLS